MRLDAFVAAAFGCSRSEAARVLQKRDVLVDGVAPRTHGLQLGPKAVVTVDGEVLVLPPPPPRAIILHKPIGFSSTRSESDGPNVYQALPPELDAVAGEIAGRLDRDTTGLLIFTIDGDLLHRITNPKRALWKRYRVRYDGMLPKDAAQRCAEGLPLPDEDRPCLSARLELHEPGSASIFLMEGRYHQVKRMFSALGTNVTALHRDRIGALDLPLDLALGAARVLSEEEIERLTTSVEML